MNRTMRIVGYIVLLAVILGSCKSQRSIIKEPIKEEGPEYLFTKLKQNELVYEYFTGKYKIDYYNENKKTEFKGQIRLRRDSVIWLSFSPALGIEMARLLITTDSIKFINRINNTYFVGDYEFVNEFLETNIDFDILQSLIIGNDLVQYDNKFRATIDDKEYKLSTAARRKLKKYAEEHENTKAYIQNIWLSPETYKISRLTIKEIGEDEKKKLEAIFNDFLLINEQLFPHEVEYNVTGDAKVKVNVNYTKIELNKKLKFPFKIPSKFERVM